MLDNDTTRESLLLRIRDRDDAEAWNEFHDLYAPLLYKYARERGLNHDDSEDIRSTCFEAIVKQIDEFDYERSKGGFKAWLRTMVNRRVIDRLRKRKELPADTQQLSQLAGSEVEAHEAWDRHWRQQHLMYCFEQVRNKVPAATYRAFEMLVRNHASVQEVCDALNLNANQVYKAKARVLQLVRDELEFLGSELDF